MIEGSKTPADFSERVDGSSHLYFFRRLFFSEVRNEKRRKGNLKVLHR